MSFGGWIKLEKDLLTDPRMTSLLCNAPALQGVTHALGCLAHVWMIADAHLGEGDVLALGPDQINQLVGVQGFAQAVPPDWLQIIDTNHVKLPGYHAHNGPEAKARALTARRVSQHRTRGNAKPLPLLNSCNGHALPDKTRLDKTLKTPLPPFDETKIAGLDLAVWREWVRYRKTNKPLKTPSLQKAAEGLAKLGAGQRAAVDYSIANGYQGLFEPKGQLAQKMAPDKSALWTEARQRANAINFRAPGNLESPESYLTAVKYAETQPRTGPRAIALTTGIAALAARLTS